MFVLVSVIIPTFNREAYLPVAVQSVVTQTFKNWELIIVDDNSTDDTFFSISDFLKDSRISYYMLEKNYGSFGVSVARNYGIKRAIGKYIAFLDSDDYWLPSKLEKQMQFMTSRGYEICQTDELWIRKGKRVNPRKIHKKISDDIFKKSLELCIVSPSAVVVKKEVFEDIGIFDESMRACEDYDLWLRASLKYKFGLLEEKLVVKRGGHDNQLSKLPALDKYRIYSLLKLLKNNKLTAVEKKHLLKVLKRKITIYLNGCIKRNKIAEVEYYEKLLNFTDSFR